MKNQMINLFICLLFSASLFAQNLKGEYYITSTGGEITLKIQSVGIGQISGILTDENGIQYALQGREESGNASGTINAANGANLYFEAVLDGKQLQFIIAPVNANQQVDYNNMQSFILNRRESTASVPNQQIIPLDKVGTSAKSGVARSMGGGSVDKWTGTFNGNINGTASTLSIQQNQTQLKGKIDAGGYIYHLEGKINGTVSQGNVVDSQTQGRMNYQANLNGQTISITFSTDQGQTFQIQFSKGGLQGSNQNTTNSSAGSLDMRLVGMWSYSSSYTSGEYSFASQYRMQINADGTFLYGDGRVIGGGPGISADSGGGGDVSRGQWRIRNKTIEINEGAGWQAYAGYYIEGQSLLLKFADGSKQVWNKSY